MTANSHDPQNHRPLRRSLAHQITGGLCPAQIDALEHPLRRRILRCLNQAAAENRATPAEQLGELGSGRAEMSYHVSVLIKGELIVRADPEEAAESLRPAPSISHAFYRSVVTSDDRIALILAATKARDEECQG